VSKKIFYYMAPTTGRFPPFLHVSQEDNGDISFEIGGDGNPVQTIVLDMPTFAVLAAELQRLGIIPRDNPKQARTPIRWTPLLKKKKERSRH
jgi:hypothetical protein